MKLKRPRISLLAIVSLLLLVSVLVLWLRSGRHGDIVGFYTPAGHLQALASDRVGILVFLSDVPFGREYGLSGDAMSVSADEFNQIHDWLYDKSREKWHFAGFRLARGKLDLTASFAPKYSALIVPYWLLAVVLAAAPLGTFRWLLIRHGRRRRGECLNCGYDLRHSTERCPECGTIIAKDCRLTQAAEAKRIVRPGAKAILFCLAAAIVAVGVVAAQSRLRGGSGELIDPFGATILDRRIAEFNLHGATLKQAIDQLAQLTGARIVLGEKLPPPASRDSGASIMLPVPEATIDLNLHDVRLRSALDVLVRQVSVRLSESLTYDFEDDGAIHVEPDALLEPTVRVYDVRDVLPEFAVRGPFSPPAENVIANMLSLDSFFCFADGRLIVIESRPTQRRVELTLRQLRRTLSGHPTPAAGDELDRQIGEMRVQNLTPAEVSHAVAKQAGTNVILDLLGFRDRGFAEDMRLAFQLREGTIRGVLSASLLAAGYHGALDYTIYDNVIFVSPYRPPRDRLAARGYDVHDLLDRYTRYIDAHPTLAMTDPGPVSLRPLLSDREQAEQDLCRAIMDIIEPDSWKENGGNGCICVLPGRVITINSAQVDVEAERLIETLRQFERASDQRGGVRSVAPPGVNRILAKMEQRLGEFHLDSVPLPQALEKLADIGGIDIVLDRPAFWDVPVTLDLHDAPLGGALSTMLRLASQLAALHYVVRDGFIYVSVDADDELLTRIYDVRDLIDVQDSQRRRSPAASSRPMVLNPERPPSLPDSRDALIETIMDGVEPESWKPSGGPASVRALGPLLIIATTLEDHRRVEALLRKLREAYGKSAVPSTRKTADH